MDERKPTYEELIKEREHQQKLKKEDNVLQSLIGFLIMFVAFAFISELAIEYYPIWVLHQGISLFVMWGFTLVVGGLFALKLFQIFISLYLAWHFVFVFIYNYETEIKEWLKVHNFCKKKTEDTSNTPPP